jgi:hypothetical protein
VDSSTKIMVTAPAASTLPDYGPDTHATVDVQVANLDGMSLVNATTKFSYCAPIIHSLDPMGG